jgi:16S rRNA (cytidine1402-2'-O)-methyltransferase
MEQLDAHDAAAGESWPALYVVATPIGNLRDITLRALDVLRSVAWVAAEDTRVTARLLGRYGIATPVAALHGHNERRVIPRVLRTLTEGKSVALVSDAGTPGISDPGAQLVNAARAAGHRVVPVPGASALTAAMSASGLTGARFQFEGFLPARAGERRRALEALRTARGALVFYEAPHRMDAALADLCELFGAKRRIVIARELTKLFESIHSCTLGQARQWLAADPHRARGEFVLIVEGAAEDEDDTVAHGRRALAVLLGEVPLKQAVALAARITGASRNSLYAMALDMKKHDE